MNPPIINCVLLADRHHGLTEAVRGLLETTFEAVVMVADETSMLESVRRLQPTLAVVDLSLPQGDDLGWLKLVHGTCPNLKVIVLSVHDEPSVRRAAMGAGADGFVVKRHIATQLLAMVDAVLAGGRDAGGNREATGSKGVAR
jgi:DNA-binding NarL/FixJ family response regulator